MSAFNSWTENTVLSNPENRKVSIVAKNLMLGSCYLARINSMKLSGIKLDDELTLFKPVNNIDEFI